MVATANLQFFENYSYNEIGAQWQQAVILSAQTQLDDVDEPESNADSTDIVVEGDTASLELESLDLESLT